MARTDSINFLFSPDILLQTCSNVWLRVFMFCLHFTAPGEAAAAAYVASSGHFGIIAMRMFTPSSYLHFTNSKLRDHFFLICHATEDKIHIYNPSKIPNRNYYFFIHRILNNVPQKVT